ncbi:phage tail fiber repeat family protein [Escherichia coli MP020940.1]|uniref:prophage tail fiber N-terminal domain-containing protein n=1 Tax=Escherichia coli TaxID=562 RepID=UPI0002C9D120|nr:prophage tail fiber N-terminal domain-containing protein [Escherichia coli]EMX50790.1 phage tail fiber repeat family protein [Escherichia coli MP020980.2]EMX58340.1 phage tail fiber repeat family protein [Escherichia coli MP020940.1]END54412.1 phage tail fiber repeat family protein [Escherichia coli MP020980.1]
MAVKISGVLKDGAGKPVVNCAIELRARRTSPTVVAHVVATCVTDNNGAYVIEAEPGYYEVALNRNGWQPTRVGDIYVAPTDTPGTLNAFLDAPKDGDLRPEVMKRFEEMVDAVTRQSEQVTDDRKRAESAADTATNAATSALDSKNKAEELKNQAQQSAEAAAKSEQNAKSHADNAAGSAQQTAQDVTATETARDDAERFANEAENSAQASGAARNESVDAAGRASQYKEAASLAATSAENAANVALGHENNAAEYARQAKASQDASAGNAQEAKQQRDEAQRIVDDLKGSNASTTEKGLVQLCSDTDNDSEELAATPKAVKTVMDETKTKAPLDSPAFTGTPTTPTPPDDAAGLETANAAFVRKLLAALVDSSPEALDTLNELAAALGNDPNFATTVTKALAGKQPLNNTLTNISKVGVGQNSLLYFGDNFEAKAIPCSNKARLLLSRNTPGDMRTELGLKAAATMEPQSYIRDRAPGRLALSGMHGFGQAFASTEALTFNGQADFVEWLKVATPGRYAVSLADSSMLLVGTKKFNGIIDVMWSPFDNDESDTIRKFKTLLCFNQYYEGEHSIHFLTYRFSGNNWNATVSPIIYDGDSLAFLLSRTAGSGSYFKYPAVGVPVLAVYRGTTFGDKEINIGLGDVVQGSQLGGVNLSCLISSPGVGSYNSAPSAGATGYTFPGRYMALSGVRDSKGITGRICLFVRIE